MAQSKQALRARIKSVNSTRKITKAMEMIANAKLFRQRNRMESNREYARRLQDMVAEIIAENPNAESVFLQKSSDNTRKLTILYCSDLGLCGAYNQNVMKAAKEYCRKEDPMIVIGTSLYRQMKDMGYAIRNERPVETDQLTYEQLKGMIDHGIEEYLAQEIGGIQIVYTKFVNTMTFRASRDILLPTELNVTGTEETPKTEGFRKETLFIPDAESILHHLIPLMINDVAYADWMEASTAEQGSRRMAMKTATDNADELSETLLLEFNKARQAAITQEITEIVGGSDAV